ncbi:MAG: aspartyl protease family protein [Chloroflexi bacterium]|nr:aspartyl protease family protein [Chloroflexota bacterium]MCH9016545.1 aspartyl protease family protein [Chloroflexota bacterium]
MWDTGATNCVITQTVIDSCGLSPISRTQVTGVHGKQESDVYLVNIRLPNAVQFVGLRVTKGEFSGADIIIGMDVITSGDFTVSSYDGITKFSFRMPSEEHLDFLPEARRKNLFQQFQHGGGGNTRKKRQKPAKKKKR